MADEKRKLIYELLVEAKGIAQQTAAAETQLKQLGQTATNVGDLVKKGFKLIIGAEATRFIAEAVSEVQKLNEQLAVLGIKGPDAAQGLKDVQNIALVTGQSMHEVIDVYKNAIEATRFLGQTQKDAAELAEAFTTATVSQGKGAAEAAQQLETLEFAIEKNNVKAKEFATLLKENELLQQAAEQALGKTTEQLIKMAQKGEITRKELILILEAFKGIAGQQVIGFTWDRFINDLQTVAKTFIDAIAAMSGLQNQLAGVNGQALKDFLELVRQLGDAIGFILAKFQNAAVFMEALGAKLHGIIMRGAAALISPQLQFGDVPKSAGEVLAEQQLAAAREQDRLLNARMVLANLRRDDIRTDPHRGLREFKAQLAAEAKLTQDAVEETTAAQRRAKDARDFEARHALVALLEGPALPTVAEMTAKIRADIEATLEAFAKAPDVMPPFIDFIKQAKEQAEALAKAITDAMADAIGFNLARAFQGGFHNFREFARELALDFASIFANTAAEAITEILKNSKAWQTITKALASAFGAEQGAAFMGGSVLPFATGGIVGGPTLFPMAGGRTGLMGEAGAEAVMPLRRMRDGRLGVSGGMPSVEIHNNTGIAANARVSMNNERLSIVLEAAQLGANLAEDRINRSLRSGYGNTAQSISRTYGLRRRV